MNKSVGSFSASAESPQIGIPSQYLCIPVKADGTTSPSQAFLSPVPPGHVVLSDSHVKMSPIKSTNPSQVKAGAYWNRRASTEENCMHPPENFFATNNKLQDQHLDGKVETGPPPTTYARQISDFLETGTPSPWADGSDIGFSDTESKCAPAPAKAKSEGRPPRHEAPSPWNNDIPDSVKSEADLVYSTPTTQDDSRQIVFSGGAGNVIMPLTSLLSGEELSDNTKRVVLAKNGTPIAFIGNTMEILSQSSTTPIEEQRKWQRWTDSEDEILRAAVTKEGAPHNWKRISRKYFLGVRSDTQCKNRWKKVSATFKLGCPPSCGYIDIAFIICCSRLYVYFLFEGSSARFDSRLLDR